MHTLGEDLEQDNKPKKNPEDTESNGHADLEKEYIENGKVSQFKYIKASEYHNNVMLDIL